MSKTVYQLIAAVSAEIAEIGISKNRNNAQQGYKFRGIDDVYNTLAPIMSKAGLVILPRILNREVTERQSAKGNAMFYVTVEAEFDFVSSHDGTKHTVKTYGEAMDTADKATNKAMSAAYKYAALQTFCIPTEGDNDADASSNGAAAKKLPPYLASKFDVNFPQWEKSIKDGKQTADVIINTISSAYILSDEQKSKIKEVK